MNYYERHIGDYLKDTAHLSLMHHGVYARLMDVYYTREHGFAEGEAHRLIGARTKDEKEACTEVLAEFFILQGGVWIQGRCDAEIARYRDKQEKAKRSAEARWSESGRNANASASGDAKRMRTHSEGNALQSPDTRPNASEAIASAAAAAQVDAAEAVFALGLPLLTASGVSEKHSRSFLGRLRKFNGDGVILAAIDRCAKANAIQPVEFLQGCLKVSAIHHNRQEALEESNRAVGDAWVKEMQHAN